MATSSQGSFFSLADSYFCTGCAGIVRLCLRPRELYATNNHRLMSGTPDHLDGVSESNARLKLLRAAQWTIQATVEGGGGACPRVRKVDDTLQLLQIHHADQWSSPATGRYILGTVERMLFEDGAMNGVSDIEFNESSESAIAMATKKSKSVRAPTRVRLPAGREALPGRLQRGRSEQGSLLLARAASERVRMSRNDSNDNRQHIMTFLRFVVCSVPAPVPEGIPIHLAHRLLSGADLDPHAK